MAVSVKIELDTRSQKKDGTYPLKLLVVIDRKPIRIPLRYSILEKDWNEANQAIKPTSKVVKNITRLNHMLQTEKTDALETITKLIDTGQIDRLSPAEIKACLTRKTTVDTHLISFFNTVITELNIAGSVGNARVYEMVRDSISNFLNGKDVPLSGLTYKWLEEYEGWFLSKIGKKDRRNTYNGLSVNLRTLRALLNRAIKRDLLPFESYPFKKYSIKKGKTKKRAVKLNEMDALINYVPSTRNQEKAKDYFLISYYLMGASFVDLAFLKVENIINGRVEFTRRKGGRLYSIKITPPLQRLLDKYLTGKSGDDFILDVIKEKVDRRLYKDVCFDNGFIEYHIRDCESIRKIKVSEELAQHVKGKEAGKKRQDFLLILVATWEEKKQYANIRDELKRYNDNMKVIANACGIGHKVTSYVARHSYATIAKFKDVPIPVISQALGHSDLKTTEVYLAEFETEVMDKYNEIVIGL